MVQTSPETTLRGQPEMVPLRHYGRWVGGVIAILVLGYVVWLFGSSSIDWGTVRSFLTVGVILKGLGNTVLISVVSMVLGVAIGVVFALMRLSENPVTRTISWLYVWLFRGTPVYLQLLMWFNLAIILPRIGFPGLGSVPTVSLITSFVAAVLGLGVNEGAYVAEIVRAGISSVAPGQREAAMAIGMRPMAIMRRIVLPQAMRVVLPPLGNDFVNLLKTSALASAISYSELLNSAQQIYFINSKVMELLIVAAVWYLVVVSVFSVLQYFVERRFNRGTARSAGPTLLETLWRTVTSTRRGNRRAGGGNE
ncbi:amino acid ABC transporter permease [Streptomyces sp. NRRL F-5126]|uniref:amino acid ABC transporter permease n=1 Tax=Streptomyces sp. NRRL F-5126 TaxID=1463857 RepID=UPI0004CA815B|nr:amino acid ABC transporter permease [Streptomyces sp. NRRL F-5126]